LNVGCKIIAIFDIRISYKMEKRVFIAFDIKNTSEIFTRIESLRNDLPQNNIKWVPAENYHITLKFLGDLHVKKIEAVQQSLHRISKFQSPFDVKVSGIGAFRNWSRPEVVWLGISTPRPHTKLHTDLDKEFEFVGVAPDKHLYKPHLTLARIRNSEGLTDIREPARKHFSSLELIETVSEIVLYDSLITPQGPKYTAIERYNFT